MADVVRFPPNRILPIIRKLEFGETDRYVRAVVKNVTALTTTLATKNLTHRGTPNGYYNDLTYTTPSDTDIVIQVVISVYTDSGYTTLDANYDEQVNLYHILPQTPAGFAIGGLSRSRITEEEVADLARRVWEYKPKTVPAKDSAAQVLLASAVKPAPADFAPIRAALHGIANEFPRLRGAVSGSADGIAKAVDDLRREIDKLCLSNLVADRRRGEVVQTIVAIQEAVQAVSKQFGAFDATKPLLPVIKTQERLISMADALQTLLARMYTHIKQFQAEKPVSPLELLGNHVEVAIRLKGETPLHEVGREVKKIQDSLVAMDLQHTIDRRLHDIEA